MLFLRQFKTKLAELLNRLLKVKNIYFEGIIVIVLRRDIDKNSVILEYSARSFVLSLKLLLYL